MNVRVNGETSALDERATVESLLSTLDYGDRSVVVAINEVFVPRPMYPTKVLNEDDRVEILGPMQGG